MKKVPKTDAREISTMWYCLHRCLKLRILGERMLAVILKLGFCASTIADVGGTIHSISCVQTSLGFSNCSQVRQAAAEMDLAFSGLLTLPDKILGEENKVF
jgi:hypothetical protein